MPRPRSRRTLGAVLALSTAAITALAGPGTTADALPRPSLPHTVVPHTVVLDGARLAVTRLRVHAHDPRLREPLAQLTAAADRYLTRGPWTVLDKPQTPPSGDKHDYLSQAPYWWATGAPGPGNPRGCPYVERDGQRNPEIDTITDHGEALTLFGAVYDLTLAWYYTGRPEYAQRAALDLRTWFLDPATRMNPNLKYTQSVPCRWDGRGIGIIDFSQQFTDVLDATAILASGAPGWTTADQHGMTAWCADLLTWLRTSENGADEAAASNNHGSFFDLLTAGLAAATGQDALAADIARTAATRRLDVQLAGDGSQPLELTRTRSWHYSAFNLLALTRLAMLGQHLGVDLWAHTTPNGGSISKSVDFLIPAATGAAPWPHPELKFTPYAADEVVRAAADHGDRTARHAVADLPAPPGGDLWPLRPAPEQLDSINQG